MLMEWLVNGRRDHASTGHLNEQLQNRFAVQQLVVALIAVVHEAVVAGSFTIFPRSRSPLSVLKGHRVEMADLQCLARDVLEYLRVIQESAQHARSALCGFVEKNESPF